MTVAAPVRGGPSRPSSILIVGGGLAGLALGRALRARGFSPEIVERAGDSPTGGAGLYIPANGVRALDSLGLGAPLLARAVRISHQRLLDDKGRLLTDVDVSRVWAPVGPCVGISRAALHQTLLEGAAGVPLRRGVTVSELKQSPDTVTVGFDDGLSRDYAVVVGADGIRSSIRRLLFPEIRPRYFGQLSWRFIARDPFGVTAWTAMLARDRAFLMLPIAPGNLYCYADLVSREAQDGAAGNRARFRALFAGFAEPVPTLLGQLSDVETIHFSPIEEVSLDTWSSGRVVLIGDAAHATSPNMAEGASLAIEDAVVLGEMLAMGRPAGETLAAFTERRRARVRWVQQRTQRRDRIRNWPVLLRNLAIRLGGPALYKRDYQPLFEVP